MQYIYIFIEPISEADKFARSQFAVFPVWADVNTFQSRRLVRLFVDELNNGICSMIHVSIYFPQTATMSLTSSKEMV